MTRELGTCANYALPQAWAAALSRTGRHAGIRYQTRLRTGAKPNAAALFGDAGGCDWPPDPGAVDGAVACADAGITVAARPTRRQVRILRPPR